MTLIWPKRNQKSLIKLTTIAQFPFLCDDNSFGCEENDPTLAYIFCYFWVREMFVDILRKRIFLDQSIATEHYIALL